MSQYWIKSKSLLQKFQNFKWY